MYGCRCSSAVHATLTACQKQWLSWSQSEQRRTRVSLLLCHGSMQFLLALLLRHHAQSLHLVGCSHLWQQQAVANSMLIDIAKTRR
jgi:hypothetical protein